MYIFALGQEEAKWINTEEKDLRAAGEEIEQEN